MFGSRAMTGCSKLACTCSRCRFRTPATAYLSTCICACLNKGYCVGSPPKDPVPTNYADINGDGRSLDTLPGTVDIMGYHAACSPGHGTGHSARCRAGYWAWCWKLSGGMRWLVRCWGYSARNNVAYCDWLRWVQCTMQSWGTGAGSTLCATRRWGRTHTRRHCRAADWRRRCHCLVAPASTARYIFLKRDISCDLL